MDLCHLSVNLDSHVKESLSFSFRFLAQLSLARYLRKSGNFFHKWLWFLGLVMKNVLHVTGG